MSQRITITLDEALAEAAQLAVAEGRSSSVSAYISEAVQFRIERDARLDALSQFVSDYEQQHGAISETELAEQEQSDRDAAARVRSARRRAG